MPEYSISGTVTYTSVNTFYTTKDMPFDKEALAKILLKRAAAEESSLFYSYIDDMEFIVTERSYILQDKNKQNTFELLKQDLYWDCI